jgi:hypothetical protein
LGSRDSPRPTRRMPADPVGTDRSAPAGGSTAGCSGSVRGGAATGWGGRSSHSQVDEGLLRWGRQWHGAAPGVVRCFERERPVALLWRDDLPHPVNGDIPPLFLRGANKICQFCRVELTSPLAARVEHVPQKHAWDSAGSEAGELSPDKGRLEVNQRSERDSHPWELLPPNGTPMAKYPQWTRSSEPLTGTAWPAATRTPAVLHGRGGTG